VSDSVTRPGSLIIFEYNSPNSLNTRLYLGSDAIFVPSLNVKMLHPRTSGVVHVLSLSVSNIFWKIKAKVV
jgi:hypothetical protein